MSIPVPDQVTKILVSTSDQSPENLALERVLLEHGFRGVMLYADGPAVVIGKHQNPWLEVKSRNFPVYRRISGGGSVYHDHGNLNIGFFLDRGGFRTDLTHDIVRSILQLWEIEVDVNARGDILYQGKKVSGNALAYKKESVMHHMTLLVSAGLADLRGSLGSSLPQTWEFAGRPVRSVPSPVTYLPGLSIDRLIGALVELMGCPSETASASQLAQRLGLEEQFRDALVLHLDQRWNWGHTPRFSLKKNWGEGEKMMTGTLTINKGQVSSFRVHIGDGPAQELSLEEQQLGFRGSASLEAIDSWAQQFDRRIGSSSVDNDHWTALLGLLQASHI